MLAYPTLHCGSMLRPGYRKVELSVNAVYRRSTGIDALKSLTENFFDYHASPNGWPTDVQVRRRWRISRDTAWVGKMGFIVATSTCHSQGHCKASSSSSCTSHSLLIIETLGWHVPHHNSEQSTDVHSGFHGRSNAEQVNGIHTGNLWC